MAYRHRGPSAGSVLVLPSAPPAPSPLAAFETRPAGRPNTAGGRRDRYHNNQSASARSGKTSLSNEPWSPSGTMRMSSAGAGSENDSDIGRKVRCCCCCGADDGIGCKGRCLRCIARCAKALLIVPNLLFMMAGAALLAVGIWARFRQSTSTEEFLSGGGGSDVIQLQLIPGLAPLLALLDRQQITTAIIVLACIIVLLGFLGCCGACSEIPCVLCLYSVLLLILVVIEVTCCVIYGVAQHQIHSTMEAGIRNRLVNSYRGTGQYRFTIADNDDDTELKSERFSSWWDKTQIELSCCGSSGPDDFQFSAWRNATRRNLVDPPVAVPPSCCDPDERLPAEAESAVAQTTTEPTTWSIERCQRTAFERWQNSDDVKTINRKRRLTNLRERGRLKTEGCSRIMTAQIDRYSFILLGGTCTIVLLQITNLVMACVLARYVRHKAEARKIEPWDDDEIDFY